MQMQGKAQSWQGRPQDAPSGVRRLRVLESHVLQSSRVLRLVYCPQSARMITQTCAGSTGSQDEDVDVISASPCDPWDAGSLPRTLRVGDTECGIRAPLAPHLVPTVVAAEPGLGLGDTLGQQCVLAHLRWMLQKDALGQDMFLIGPPGPLRRWLAMRFCELSVREMEYVALTPDTTESDLKQRREIVDGTAIYVDREAVRAAVSGRVLVLEGIEKCERNVLPILNNLLENREMMLEDGRFLCAPDRYDALMETHTQEALRDRLRLVRVHPSFRVIVLGLPVPKFRGNPLDPPLRSRFQARHVGSPSVPARLTQLHAVAQGSRVASNTLRRLVSLSEALGTMTEGAHAADVVAKLPAFPFDAPAYVVRHLAALPGSAVPLLLDRAYPYRLITTAPEQDAVRAGLTQLNLEDALVTDDVAHRSPASLAHVPSSTRARHWRLHAVRPLGPAHAPAPAGALLAAARRGSSDRPVAHLVFRSAGEAEAEAEEVCMQCVTGQAFAHLTRNGPTSLSAAADASHVPIAYQNQMLSDMLSDHALGYDVCLVGDKGCGKSQLIRQFANVLGYVPHETVHLYSDMTARDLFQRRTTKSNGDTDGIHHLKAATLAILARLLQDREATLFDGTQLVHPLRWDAMRARCSSPDVLTRLGLLRVHPSFRIIASAPPPAAKKPWLSSETISLFKFHHMRPMLASEKMSLLHSLFPSMQPHQLDALLRFDRLITEQYTKERLASPDSPAAEALHPPSIRQYIRMCSRATEYPEDLYDVVRRNYLVPFMPHAVREVVLQCLTSANIGAPQPLQQQPQQSESESSAAVPSSDAAPSAPRAAEAEAQRVVLIEPVYGGDAEAQVGVRFGDVWVPTVAPRWPALVPHVLFYEVPKHTAALREMAKDWNLGEHMLLIGNQGVGKNKLVDKLLELLQREREYIQLHRDTTVQSLTLAPSLSKGVIVWEDSPLVKAVRYGRVLVIDEADKAPVEVVSVLKGLIADGEMLLSDGRKILRADVAERLTDASDVVPVHPAFRCIVLANRPGFPFLGNNFFADIGDCFSSHVIDNPDLESEVMLLRSYAPDVPEYVLRRLSLLFLDLRAMVDEGLLSYPYSTRELVNIVRHLQRFPKDSLSRTIENVFSFDGHDPQLLAHLTTVLHKHGIPFRADTLEFRVRTAEVQPLPQYTLLGHLVVQEGHAEGLGVSHRACWGAVGGWQESLGPLLHVKGRTEGRITQFSEHRFSWNVLGDEQSYRTTSARAGSAAEAPSGGPQTQAVADMCVLLDGSVVFVATHPLTLFHYTPQLTHYRVYRVGSSHVPGHANVTYAQPPRLWACPGSGRLLLWLPTYEAVLAFHMAPHDYASADSPAPQGPASMSLSDAAAMQVAVFAAPVGASTAFTVFNDQVYLKPRTAEANVREGIVCFGEQQCDSDSDELYMFRYHTNRIHVLDVNGCAATCARTTTITLPQHVNVEQVSVIRDHVLIVRDAAQQMWLVRPSHADARAALLRLHTSDAALARASPLCELPPLAGDARATEATLWQSPRVWRAMAHVGWDRVAVGSSVPVRGNARAPGGEGAVVPLVCAVGAHSRQVLRVEGDTGSQAIVMHVLPTHDLRLSTPDIVHELAADALVRTIRLPGRVASVAAPPGAPAGVGPRVHVLNAPIAVQELPNGCALVLQSDGTASVWDVNAQRVGEELASWRSLIGKENDEALALEYDEVIDAQEEEGGGEGMGERDADGDPAEAVEPKEGEEDGQPHTGGNRFAGGSGGSSTRGQGGRGGFRRGEVTGGIITQISPKQLQEMSEEVVAAQREMARKALEERLREIEMSDYEAHQYDRYLSVVRKEVQQLRVVLEGVEAKGRERVWLKGKQNGELDDMRLVDGIAGERAIYKQRGKEDPMHKGFQTSPKRLCFVMDVSASMYRFNSTDGRLDRMLSSLVMIMEALHGFEAKYEWAVVGHSGDGPDVPFVDFGKPPKDERERLQVLRKMQAHTEYCQSGDFTLEAAKRAIDVVTRDEGDDYFVFLLSDANLPRYGISPKDLGRLLTKDERVSAFAIFIASVGNVADQIKSALPLGKAHVCLDTAELPKIFKQLFTSVVQ